MTSTRSSHIGQMGYDTEEDWEHYVKKYGEWFIRYGRTYLMNRGASGNGNREGLLKDALQKTLNRIYQNPYAIHIDPDRHYRPILKIIYRSELIDLIRECHKDARDNYVASMAELLPRYHVFEEDRRRLQLLVISQFISNMNKPCFRQSPEVRNFNSEYLDIWLELQTKGATLREVAKAHDCSITQTFVRRNKAEEFIVQLASKHLQAYGLL